MRGHVCVYGRINTCKKTAHQRGTNSGLRQHVKLTKAHEQCHIHGNWNLGHQNSAKPEQNYQHTLVSTTGLNMQEKWWLLSGQATGQPPHTHRHISIRWMSEQTDRVCPWELCYNKVWTYKSVWCEKHLLPTINGKKAVKEKCVPPVPLLIYKSNPVDPVREKIICNTYIQLQSH